METTIMGCIGIIGYVLGLYWNNGKENGNYYIVYWVLGLGCKAWKNSLCCGTSRNCKLRANVHRLRGSLFSYSYLSRVALQWCLVP